MPKKEDPRTKVHGTIPDDLYKWAEDRIGKREFFGWSHALELALRKLREDAERKDR